MNKIAATLPAIFYVACSGILAQTATLKGKVTDAGTNSPLISATVQAGADGTITDLDGSFEQKLQAGTYEISVSYVGFETQNKQVTLGAGETQTVSFALNESSNILQTATVTSGKHERALGEVTVSIDVIKPALIESTNQTSLSGLLDKVPGVNLVGDQANIRGGSGFSYGAGSRVLLLVDDIPIYQADAGFPQWEDVPLENIEQVEVVKGAASALYGSSALNGIINVRTAYAKSKPETKIAPFYTVFMNPENEAAKWWDTPPYTTGISASHKRKIGRLDLILGGYYYRNSSVNDSTFSRRGRWNLNARYRITDRLSVGMNSTFNKANGRSFFFWGGTDSLIYRPGAAVSESSSFRYNIDPYLTYYDPANNRHKIMSRFYNVDNNTGTSEADQSNISQVYYGEYQFQHKSEKTGLVTTAGFVYNGTRVRAPLYGDTTFTSRNLAGYVQLEKRLFGKLNLSGGFRYEHNLILTPDSILYDPDGDGATDFTGTVPNGEIKESKPVVRIGASYELSPTSFLRASWGQGYRFPTIAEKFIYTYFGGVPISPNFDLTSETGWTAELGLRKGFQISEFNAFLDVATFWSEYQDMMEFLFVDFFSTGFQSQNVGDTRIKGYEASITGRGKLFGMETSMLVGYTYIDPKFQQFASIDSLKNGSEAFKQTDAYKNAINSSVCHDIPNCNNILKYRYKHNFKLDVESKLNKGSLGVAVFYNSFMENIDEIFEAIVVPGLRDFRQKYKNGDLILNIRGAYELTENTKASLLVDNLLNREYSNRPGLLRPTRNVTLRLDFDF
jgi:outer membrane receptor protein involved in Fe transport